MKASTMAIAQTTVSYVSPFSGLFARVIGAVLAWNDARMTRNALLSLTNRELADIGLNRGDIERVAAQK